MTVPAILRRHAWPVFLGLWTLGVVALVIWIFNRPPAEPIVIRSSQAGDTGAWPLFDRTFHPVYPWLMLAPWVIWLCLRFPIGLRRTAVALPLLLVGGSTFLLLSLSFTTAYSERLPPLFYISTLKGAIAQKVVIDGKELPLSKPPAGKPDTPSPVKVKLEVEGLKDLLGQIEEELGLPIDEEQIGRQIERVMVNPEAVGEGERPEVTVVATPRASELSDPDGAVAGLEELAAADLGKKTLSTSVVQSTLHLGGFLLIGGLTHLGVFVRHIRDREQRHAIISKELAEARLSELQGQLRPHFLFNALNSISSEVHESPDDAVNMIVHLSDLLRGSLALERGSNLIPLHHELELLDHYLALQSHRFGDRLTVERNFPSETLRIPVPPFVLQPLVENAVQHGLEPIARQGTLSLSSELDGGELVIRIEDNGVGLQDSPATQGSGTGLTNIRHRLETLFPGQYQLELEAADYGHGTHVTLRLPVS